MSPRIDPERVTALIRETAQAEILPRFRHLEAHQIREKKPGDLVTEADTASEKVLTARLQDLLPGSLVVGEEAVAADPAVLDRLGKNEPVWIIDPVDGTANFAHGRPTFAVIIALVQGGETRMGWIYDPLAELAVTAEQGSGAWQGETHLAVKPAPELKEMVGSVGHMISPRMLGAVRRLVRHGSAGHDYLAMARGLQDFSYFRRQMPWDHAAGVLIHREAGGYVASMDGTPYTPFPRETGILSAPDEEVWHRLQPLIVAS